MAPAWDELEEYYAGQKKVVVGDVDCTTDRNKKLCEQHEVKSYPTIKIYTPETGAEGEKYEGALTTKARAASNVSSAPASGSECPACGAMRRRPGPRHDANVR